MTRPPLGPPRRRRTDADLDGGHAHSVTNREQSSSWEAVCRMPTYTATSEHGGIPLIHMRGAALPGGRRTRAGSVLNESGTRSYHGQGELDSVCGQGSTLWVTLPLTCCTD